MPSNGANAGPKRPTIRDVAAAAGVSKSLVSLVFSNPDSVSAVRRERVLAAAATLDFRPNWVARSLAADDGNFIGILVADLHNPVLAEVVDAARLELARAGRFSLMTSAVLPSDGGVAQLDTRILAAFGDLRPSSVLLVGSVPEMASLSQLAYQLPIVVASAIAEDLPLARSVRSNEMLGMALVVDHLVEQGHSRIAHIGGLGGPVSTKRAEAYRAAMKAHGLDAEVRVESADFSEASGYTAARNLLTRPGQKPTAITAVNDLAALGALAAADDLRLSVPEDLALTGYDNTFLAAFHRISLTSIDPHNREIGATAVKFLLNADRADEESQLIEPRLVVRRSSRP
ncbi:LacI family DNA-binding transcriptional regulator [Microbacterium allomyrinae]|uniref:LacI family DNA-binding transcriptional regulator n=1 Tax=Microbacterium allomyrinae TaxID=2830666 RepID=A0A9X1S228_9MICO|nr:LacI family DNA-binding transcriptional regulator [Microbacterium allomyrinae]MCC2031544.1 LacI family DNA-binding transcriptional regulator [Microbacterium allomyrinae]